MKKRLPALLAVLIMICMCICPVLSHAEFTTDPDFYIEDGELLKYIGVSADVVIPDGVRIIGDNAFFNTPAEYVTLPDTVTMIGDSAFYGTALRKINLPDGLRIIGDDAFKNTMLTEIDIPYGITKIPRSAFFCTPLAKITIPDSVRIIDEFAFCNTNVKDVRIPDSVTKAYASSFMGTPFMKALVKENGGWLVLSNGLLVCYAGDDINVIMPDNVISVGALSFQGRTRMRTLTIPPQVRSIEETPFINCKPQIIYSVNPVAEDLGITCLPSPEIPPENGRRALDISSETWRFENDSAVFGDTFILSDNARSQLKECISEKYQASEEGWSGSCYGMVLTALLAKSGLLSPSDIQDGAQSIGDITPEDTVFSVINYYQFTQFTDAAAGIERHSGMSDADFFEHIISLGWQAEDKGIPFLFSFDTGSGGHTCAGCGIESGHWEWNSRSYDRRIVLWDPNYPEEYRDDVCLYYRESDHAYCIPLYGVQYTLGGSDNMGRLKSASDDIGVLGEPAYPFRRSSAVRGDINGSGSPDAADLVLLHKWLLGVPDTRLPHIQAADLNNDKSIDTFDLCLLRQDLITM